MSTSAILTPERAREIFEAIKLTPAELDSKRLRDSRARDLFAYNDHASITAAIRHFDLLAAGGAGMEVALIPEVIKYQAKNEEIHAAQEELRTLNSLIHGRQEQIRRARTQVSRIEKYIAEEKTRIAEYTRSAREWRENYFSNVVGNQNPAASPFGFYQNIVDALAIAEFTRTEVLPELERQLAEANKTLSSLNKAAA